MGLWDSIRALFSEPPGPVIDTSLRREWKFAHDTQWDTRTIDAQSLAVFADWLEENGDARAEFIRLAPTPERFTAFLRANAEPLFDRLVPKLTFENVRGQHGSPEEQIDLEWTDGILRGASVRTSKVRDDAQFLLRLPIARTLKHLALGLQEPLDPLFDSEQLSALGELGARLDSLFVGDFRYPTECEMSWAQLGDVSAVWKSLPQLRRLKLRGIVEDLGTVEAPKLTHFTHETSGLTKLELSKITAARWPELTHLELWFGSDNYGSDCVVDDVVPLLNRKLPSLHRLALRNFAYVDGLIERLAPSPLLQQVKELDLSMGMLAEEGAQALLDHRARFAHLTELNLSDNFIPPAELERLTQAFGTSVKLGTQKEEDGDYRYVSVSE
ncbi:MAG: TIGR02996 domain-containing protein [Archangium sp.]